MTQNLSLSGRIAVITGGSRGIGASIASKLAELGADTVILGRDRPALDSVAERINARGHRCIGLVCNVEHQPEVEAAAREVKTRLGAPDILVNGAGIGLQGHSLLECTPEDWDRVMNTNLRGVFYAIRAFVPSMVKAQRGHVINISSIAGKNPLPGGAIYAASKWGLNGLSFSLAEELRVHGIRVSVVSPGSVNTEFSSHEGRNLSRMLTPDDVAHAVEMLVTQERQSFISEIILRPTQKP